jgi:hypothetical protein
MPNYFASKWVTVGLIAALVAPAVGQSGMHTRILPFSYHAIVDRLLPDDQVVILLSDDSDRAVTPRDPTASEALEAQLNGPYGNLAIIEVTSTSGTLIDSGRWIATEFRGSVVELLTTSKEGSPRLPVKGTPIGFSFEGGEVKIGTVIVRTNNAPTYPVGRRYLVFLGPPVPWGTGSLVAGVEPLLIEGNRLIEVGTTHSAIAKLTVRDIRRKAGSVRR